MSGEDDHLEADYEDRNGDPHGIGSPEWEEQDAMEYDDEDDINAFLETRFGSR